MRKVEIMIVAVAMIFAMIFTGCRSAQPAAVVAQDVVENVEGSAEEITDVDFTLSRSSTVMIRTYAMGAFGSNAGTRGLYNRLERHLRAAGFCCVVRNRDNDADFTIILHPTGPFTWGFRIHDESLDKRVYSRSFPHMLTQDVTIGNFMRDIERFIVD